MYPNPEKWDPERMLNNDNLDMMGLNNLNAMPFGGGKRVCPGISQVKNSAHEKKQKNKI